MHSAICTHVWGSSDGFCHVALYSEEIFKIEKSKELAYQNLESVFCTSSGDQGIHHGDTNGDDGHYRLGQF